MPVIFRSIRGTLYAGIILYLLGQSMVSGQEHSRRVTLSAHDESQQPVVGAAVAIRQQAGNMTRTCTTSNDGICTAEALPDGPLVISVQGPFHEPTTRTMGVDGSYSEAVEDSAEWSPPFGRQNISIDVELKSTVAKARDALWTLKLAATRFVQNNQFQEGINANAAAVSAFDHVSSVDRRVIVLNDGVEVLTLAGILRQHLGGGLDRAAEYLRRAEDLAGEVETRPEHGDSRFALPDNLLRAKIMLAIQQDRPEDACTIIEKAATEREWLAADTGDPFLASEGDTQWWTENRLREDFRDLALSISLVVQHPLQRCSDIAFKLTLATKGRILDGTTRKIAWLRQGVPASYQHYVSELQAIWDEQSLTFIRQARAGVGRRELEDFASTPPWRHGDLPKSPEHQVRQNLRDRESRLLKILFQVRKKSPSREKSAPDRLYEIRTRLPLDAALVEFCRYRPFTGRGRDEQPESIYDPDRYAAFVIRREGNVRVVDLGEAEDTDDRANLLLELIALAGDPLDKEALAGAEKDYRAAAAEMFNRILAPTLPNLDSVHHLIIGPERGLAVVPFAALQMPDGRYAIERFLITYVASANDLVSGADGPATQRPSLLIGAPDFGHNKAGHEDDWSEESIMRTRSEVRSVRARLGEGMVLIGSAATKSALRKIQSPRILHIATHAISDDNGGSSQPGGQRYLAAELLGFDREIEVEPERPEEHFLRPKVVLAGANADPNNGLMNAAELSHIDLNGTEIATLSACQTGLGVMRNDEGVYSLRRALAIAGSRTQVTSLWSVDDDATQAIMVAFYGDASKGRGEALRKAQLKFANGKDIRLQHPYFWAAFQLSGQWIALKPKAAFAKGGAAQASSK